MICCPIIILCCVVVVFLFVFCSALFHRYNLLAPGNAHETFLDMMSLHAGCDVHVGEKYGANKVRSIVILSGFFFMCVYVDVLCFAVGLF